MKNMHHNKHNNNTKHHSKCNSKNQFQPQIIVPPINHPLPQPDVIVVSGITSLNPSQGPIIGGNFIIINGFNLIFTVSVSMGGNNVPFTLLSNTQLQITAIPRNTSQTVQIIVNFKNGSSESLSYNYIDTANIISLTPSSGPITGNNIITITGTGLSSTTSVYFNNIITFSFVITSNTSINVAVPNLTGQSNVSVHVITTGGSSNNLSYTLIPSPVI